MNWRAGERPLVGNPLSDDPWPVEAKRLLTEREQSLYQSILSLYPNHKVFVQVAMSQLIDVPQNHPDRQSIRNRFSQLVADFVLCRSDLSVIAVIELDDRSHRRADRQDADARKNKALADAGIRLVRIPAGPSPSEDFLRTLIDANGKTPGSPQEETVLTLAEDNYAPASSYGSNESSVVAQEFKQVALKAGALVILLLVGWLFFSSLLPALMQQAFAPLENKLVRVAAAPPKLIRLTPQQSLASPVVTGPTAAKLAAHGEQALQAANALQKKKDMAWAAFYTAPVSCEHPADWSAQVECGNQYMRARKRFEERWAASQVSGAEAVLVNGSGNGLHK